MSKKQPQKEPKEQRELKLRDPFAGIPYGVNALIRNEGSTIEEVRLADIDLQDELLRLRPSARLDLLVESIDLVGQQMPVVLRYREANKKWQIVCGFRRIEALRQLKRPGVIARLFDDLSDEDAIKTAVTNNFFSGDLTGEHLDAFMERLRNENLLAGATLEFLDWAREKVARVAPTGGEPAATEGEEHAPAEASLTDLIDRTFVNRSEASQGLERLFLNWSDVSPSDRKLLAAECKYIHDLYPFLTR